MINSALLGKYSNNVGGGSPGPRLTNSVNSFRCLRRRGGLDHFNVKLGALFYTLCFEQFLCCGKFCNTCFELLFNLFAGLLQSGARCDAEFAKIVMLSSVAVLNR